MNPCVVHCTWLLIVVLFGSIVSDTNALTKSVSAIKVTPGTPSLRSLATNSKSKKFLIQSNGHQSLRNEDPVETQSDGAVSIAAHHERRSNSNQRLRLKASPFHPTAKASPSTSAVETVRPSKEQALPVIQFTSGSFLLSGNSIVLASLSFGFPSVSSTFFSNDFSAQFSTYTSAGISSQTSGQYTSAGISSQTSGQYTSAGISSQTSAQYTSAGISSQTSAQFSINIDTSVSYNFLSFFNSGSGFFSTLATTVPTQQPTVLPTAPPTAQPSTVPTFRPTPLPGFPTISPTLEPTFLPTAAPTTAPTALPTVVPTFHPTPLPGSPTISPSLEPTFHPTAAPTTAPTALPTVVPTLRPTPPPGSPTISPTSEPTSATPTTAPTTAPTFTPTTTPTFKPTRKPTQQPTRKPTSKPSFKPTRSPTQPPGEVLSFSTNATLSGFLEPAVNETDVFIVLNTTAVSMGTSYKNLQSTGATVTPVVTRRLSSSADGRSVEVLETSFTIDYEYEVVVAVAATDEDDAENLYSSLTSSLNQSVADGSYDRTLNANAQEQGVVLPPSVAVQSVTVGPASVQVVGEDDDDDKSSGGKKNGSKSDDDDGGLSDGAIAGIVIGTVAGVAIIGGLIYYFFFYTASSTAEGAPLKAIDIDL